MTIRHANSVQVGPAWRSTANPLHAKLNRIVDALVEAKGLAHDLRDDPESLGYLVYLTREIEKVTHGRVWYLPPHLQARPSHDG